MSKKIKKEELRVSLLPGEDWGNERKILTTKKSLIIVLIVLAAFLIILSGYLRIRAGRFRISAVKFQNELEQLGGELKLLEENFQKSGNIGQRIGFAKSALDNHIASEQVMIILSASAIPEVALSQIAVDASGTIILTGRGVDFNAVIRQIMAWREYDKITDVQISGISTVVNKLGAIEGVDFNATITLKDKVLNWQP